jgi:hypothetical protein
MYMDANHVQYVCERVAEKEPKKFLTLHISSSQKPQEDFSLAAFQLGIASYPASTDPVL